MDFDKMVRLRVQAIKIQGSWRSLIISVAPESGDLAEDDALEAMELMERFFNDYRQMGSRRTATGDRIDRLVF